VNSGFRDGSVVFHEPSRSSRFVPSIGAIRPPATENRSEWIFTQVNEQLEYDTATNDAQTERKEERFTGEHSYRSGLWIRPLSGNIGDRLATANQQLESTWSSNDRQIRQRSTDERPTETRATTPSLPGCVYQMTLPFVTPVEILTGVSFGLLFGSVTAAAVGCLSFVAAVAGDVTIPRFAGGTGAVVLSSGASFAAGVVGPETVQPGLLLGLGLVFVLGLAATSWGRQLGTDLPRSTAGSIDRTQPLAADAIDAVDAMGQVTIRSSGSVREFEGYPPLGPALRQSLADGAWRLPADLPLSALETRLEAQLRSTYDLERVSVAVDRRGRATITAAPPTNGVAKRVPEGWRAISVRTLVPTGLAPGDDVLATTGTDAVSGTVLSATVDSTPTIATPQASAAADRAVTGDRTDDTTQSGVVDGGEGQVTLAIPTTAADTLLDADRVRIVVTPAGTAAERDAISLLERNGVPVRKTTLTESVLDAVSSNESELEVFAVRSADAAGDVTHDWQFEPDPDALAIGSEAFLLGGDAVSEGSEPTEPTTAAVEVSH